MFRKNKVPWIVGGLLIVLLGGGTLLMGGKEKKPKSATTPPESARALVLPANRSRTVIVPPCNTPVSQTVQNAASGQGTPGATAVELPRAEGVRTVLVPHCQPGTGSTNVEGNVPSAILVVGGSERLQESEAGIQSDGAVAKSQIVLPESSTAATIVVPPCKKKQGAKGQDAVPAEAEGGSGIVTAPSC